MWESLPPIVLFIIYENVDLKTKLSASATCKNWRGALFSPRGTIHERLDLKFLCRPTKRRVSDVRRDMYKRFMKHTKCLVLDWCNCQEDAIIDVLTSVDSVIHTIQHVHLHSKGQFFGCKKKACNKDCASKTIIEVIITFMDACRNIRIIDFGSNPDFSRNTDLINVVDMRSKQGKLTNVNISCFDTIVTVLSSELSNRILSLIKENLLKYVKEIHIDWDEHFEDLISELTLASSSVKVLGLLVHECNFYKDVNAKTKVTKLWQQLKSHKPDMEVKLNLTEIHRGDIRTVLDKEMPLTSLCVVYSSDDFAEIVLDNLRNTSHGSNLKELGFHHIERLRLNVFFVPTQRNSNISSLITHLECLNNIQTISWSGQFVLDTDLLFLVTQHAVTLQELLIHKQEVVYESQATQEYYIPLTSAKAHGLEKTISTTLRKPWKMLNEVPVQRISRQSLSLNFYENKEPFWMLQNKGF